MHNFKETGTVQYYKGQSEKNQLTTWQRTLLANNAACAFQFRLCLPQPFPLGTYLHTSHCIQDVQVPEFIQSQTTLQWSSTWHENTFILSDMHLSIHTNIVETMIFLNFRFTKLDNLPYQLLFFKNEIIASRFLLRFLFLSLVVLQCSLFFDQQWRALWQHKLPHAVQRASNNWWTANSDEACTSC